MHQEGFNQTQGESSLNTIIRDLQLTRLAHSSDPASVKLTTSSDHPKKKPNLLSSSTSSLLVHICDIQVETLTSVSLIINMKNKGKKKNSEVI